VETLFNVLTNFFAHYGYWVIFFGVMLENGGVPLPGETILLFAGFLAYHGEINLVRAMATAAAGATIGDSLGFCLGRYGGAAFVEKYRRRVFFLRRQFDRAQTIFQEHGQWAVFVARFVTGLRIFSGILAGTLGMAYPRFLFFNFTGAVLWSLTIGSVGFLFGGSLPTLVRVVKEFHEVVFAAAVLAILVAVRFYLKRRRGGRRAADGKGEGRGSK
jgi:membrane protein DedA with SNARE-associated domain